MKRYNLRRNPRSTEHSTTRRRENEDQTDSNNEFSDIEEETTVGMNILADVNRLAADEVPGGHDGTLADAHITSRIARDDTAMGGELTNPTTATISPSTFDFTAMAALLNDFKMEFRQLNGKIDANSLQLKEEMKENNANLEKKMDQNNKQLNTDLRNEITQSNNKLRLSLMNDWNEKFSHLGTKINNLSEAQATMQREITEVKEQQAHDQAMLRDQLKSFQAKNENTIKEKISKELEKQNRELQQLIRNEEKHVLSHVNERIINTREQIDEQLSTLAEEYNNHTRRCDSGDNAHINEMILPQITDVQREKQESSPIPTMLTVIISRPLKSQPQNFARHTYILTDTSPVQDGSQFCNIALLPLNECAQLIGHKLLFNSRPRVKMKKCDSFQYEHSDLVIVS